MADQIQIRRDTASNWSSNNPTLAAGEQGWESDTNKMKVGDGSTAWNSLSYFHSQNYQSSNTQLGDIAALTPTDGNFIVGDGSNFVTESGVTVRASLGLTIGTDVQAYDAQLADIAGLNPTDGNFIVGDGSNFVLESGATARTSLGLGTISTAATSDYVATANNLSDLANASTARTNLGVAIGTDVQAYDAQLADIAGLNPTDGYIIVGDGSNFVTENGATARSSLGLTIGTDVLAHDANLSSFVSTFTLPTSDGTNGQALITDGSGTLSFSTISGGGGGGGSFTATASGSLSDGSTVIVNSDGTVSVVGETTTPAGFGSATVFENDTVYYNAATFDSNSNKVVIAYQDNNNSNRGTAVVGTVSGTSISFGTPVTFTTSTASYFSIAFDSSNNKVVIVYNDGGNSSYGTAVVGTVSGTSISFGSATVFESATVFYLSATFDSNSNKVVIAYRDHTNSEYGTAVVGTVSGTSISFGTPVVFESATVDYVSATFDSNSNKVVIAYRDAGNSYYGTAIVGTVSGTSISFGTPVVFQSVTVQYVSATFDSNSNKVVIAYQNTSSLGYGTAVVGTVSGTSISFGTPVVFESASTTRCSLTFDSSNNKVVIAYRDDGNSDYGTAIVGTVSGTSISFGSATVFESAQTDYIAPTFDSSNNRVVIAYTDRGGNPYYGTAIVYRTTAVSVTNLTAENYAGISDGAYSNAATATIQTAGSIDDAQSGLTAGQAYYVQEDGTLATTPDTTSVFAGIAINSTSLLIGKEAPDTAVAYADITGTPTIPADVSDLTDTTSLIPADVSDLTDTTSLLGGGGSGLQQDFTANGAITSGKAVILENAGTVAQVGETTTARDYPETSSTVTNYGSGNYVFRGSAHSLYIAEHSGSTKKMIHMYTDGDSSGYPIGARVRVVAYDGTNYTLGTSINISGDTTNWNKFRNTSIVSTSTPGTFLIFYTHLDATGSNTGTDYTKYRTLTYSGTTITLGSEVDFDVDISGDISFHVVEDPHLSDRYVVIYRDNANSNYYTIKVLTNSNGTISYGTKITLLSSYAYNLTQFKLDPKVEGRYLLIDGSSQTHIRTGVINYSANSATCGSAVTPGTGATQLGADWDPFNSGKIVTSYDTDYSLGQRKVQARVGSYNSGTNAVSFTASQVAFPTSGGDSGSSSIPCQVFAQPGAANQFWSVKRHESSGSDYFYVCAIEVSDTTPSITEYSSYKKHSIYALDLKDKQIAVIEFGDPGAILKYGYSKYTASNIAEGSFIGFASETVSDAGTVTVDLTGGTTTSQSSLTIGSTYYVQDDGSVGTTASSTAEVFAGKATAADTLLIGVHDSSIVKDSDIGSAVQAYNANYLTSSAVGSSVQAYDSNLTSFVSAFTLPTSDGSADQVLKTDGSGTLSFTTLSSGGGTPTATLTVAGGVSAGDIIVYNSSGSQYEAAGNVTISASITPTAVGYNGSGFRSTGINQISGPPGNGLYHTGYNKGFLITYESSARQYRWITMNSDYSVSFSSAASLPSDSIFPRFLFQPANDKIALIWSDGTNMIANVGSINLSTGAISWEASNQTLSSSDTWNTAASNGGSQLVYDSNDDKWIILYRDSLNNGMIRAISYNSSTLALTAGTAVEIEDGYLYSGGLDFDPNRNAGLVCYADTSSPYVNYRKWSCSGGTITVGTQTSISNSGYGSYSPKFPTYPAMCHYNSVTGKFVFLYGYSYNDGFNQRTWPTGYHTAVINENGTVSLSNSGVNTSFGGNSRSDGNSGWSVFDAASGTVNHAIYGSYNQAYYMWMQTFKQASDGSITAGGSQLYYYSNAGSSISSLTYSADQKYTLLCFTGASSSVGKSYSWQNELSTTNITNQVIGVATEAIADGATGSINIIGGVDDNQTGLTANQTYYLVADGTLSTTADDNNVKFGYSLSSTEIMMKGFS